MELSSSQLAAIASAAGQAVVQVILIASAGAYMRLDKKGMKTISDVAYRILLPSLMFTNVCDVVSVEALKRLFAVPLGAAVGIGLASVLAFLVAPCVGLPRGKRTVDDFTRTHFLLAASIGNHGYLPLILSPATILQGALHVPGTDLAQEVKTATSYIALYILVVNVYTWGSAAMLLRKVAAEQAKEEEERVHRRAKRRRDASRASGRSDPSLVKTTLPQLEDSLVSPGRGHPLRETDKQDVALIVEATSSKRLNPDAGRSKAYLAFRSRFVSLGASPGTAAGLAGVADFVTGVVTPPVAATLSGLCIGLIPPLKALLFVRKGGAPAAAAAMAVSLSADKAASTLPAFAATFNATAVAVSRALQRCAASAAVTSAVPLGSPLAAVAVAAATTALVRTAEGGTSLCVVGAARPWDAQLALNGTLTAALEAITLAGPCCVSLGTSAAQVAFQLALQQGGTSGDGVAPPSSAAVVPAPALVAPLGPTVTSALQAFASAIVPMVALNLGSHIVARDEPAHGAGEKTLTWRQWLAALSVSSVLQSIRGEMKAEYVPDDGREEEEEEEAGAGGSGPTKPREPPRIPVIRLAVLAALILIRLVCMPLVGIAYSFGVTRLGMVDRGDRTLIFILCLEMCTPPAMNLQLIADVMGSGGRSTARVIGVTYVTSVVTITFWISVFLVIIRGGYFD